MKRGYLAAGLVAMAFVMPASGQPKPKGGTIQAAMVMQPGQKLQGTLTKKNGSTLTVRVEIPRVQINGGNRNNGRNNNRNIINQIRNRNRNNNRNRGRNNGRNNNRNNNRSTQQQLARLQQQLARARNPQEANRIRQQMSRLMAQAQQRAAQEAARQRQQILQRIQQQQRQAIQQAQRNRGKGGTGGVKVTTESRDVMVELAATPYIRSMNPPFAYDEMGNPKQYTKEELAKLKGNSKLPGYKAELTDLKEGAIVQLTMAKDKRTGNRLQAILAVIIQEGEGPREKGRKKKN